MTISQAEFNRLKEAVEVLAGISNKAAKERRAVRWSEMAKATGGLASSDHTHDFDDIKGTVTVAWGDITGIPSTFAPSVHTHSTSDVTGLASTLSDLISRVEALEAIVMP